MIPPPLLSLKNICVSRGERTVLDHVSLTLCSGEALLVTGENGSGKSTLLRAIAGLCPLDKGSIDTPTVIGWLGHHNALKLSLTVHENLTLFSSPPQAQLTDTLCALGLEKLRDTPTRHLSDGQQRRVAFARLLLNPTSLWLLDEPTTSMDDTHITQVESLIQNHCQQGGAALVVSHTPLCLPTGKTLTLTPHQSEELCW